MVGRGSIRVGAIMAAAAERRKRKKVKSLYRSGAVASPSHEYKRKVLKRAKAKGIVIGYPGKTPAHASSSSSSSSSYNLRTADYVPYHKIQIDEQRKWHADFVRLAAKHNPQFINYRIPDDPNDPDDDAFIPKHERKRLKEWEEHFEEDFLVLDIECAEAALAYFNKKKKQKQEDVNYELVETVGTFSDDYGSWHHCNFWARPTTYASAGSTHDHDQDHDPKLFFAELTEVKGKFLEVKHCCILNQKPGSRSQLVYDCCDICSEEMAHPIKGFKVGRL